MDRGFLGASSYIADENKHMDLGTLFLIQFSAPFLSHSDFQRDVSVAGAIDRGVSYCSLIRDPRYVRLPLSAFVLLLSFVSTSCVDPRVSPPPPFPSSLTRVVTSIVLFFSPLRTPCTRLSFRVFILAFVITPSVSRLQTGLAR